MHLDPLIALARDNSASDLHLEAGLPLALRVRGTLKTVGEPIAAKDLMDLAREIIGAQQWPRFVERRSFDLSKTIQGVRCRLNILQTARGVGFAVRLLGSFQATIEKLNLHPDLKRFIAPETGLLIVSGPTGCGKSSTLAALVQEINLSQTKHIVTIESPIEYTFRSRHAYIRQREVGRDTPSFEQALLDALREDPDVLMVGEMREPETMRLTLNASETGHLVLTTTHSATCAEALQRIVFAFPAEAQSAVRVQLADCLVGVVSQRLRYRTDLKIRVPECEIMVPTIPIKNYIRSGEFFKIVQALETGAEHGMYTFQRYQTWLETKKNWFVPSEASREQPDTEPTDAPATAALPPLIAKARPIDTPARPAETAPASSPSREASRIEIEPVDGGLNEVLKKLE